MSTLGALQSNVNLPTRKTIDFDSLVSAITKIDPVEAAKLMVKTDARPEGIKTFEAYSKMSPEEQAAFRQFKQASSQIDLETIKTKKTIEVRSSFPRNGVEFAICSPKYEFDILGPYKNHYKSDEPQKDIYLSMLHLGRSLLLRYLTILVTPLKNIFISTSQLQ
jgi:hypothetical protein